MKALKILNKIDVDKYLFIKMCCKVGKSVILCH